MAATRRRIKSAIEKKNKQTHATDTTPTRYGTSVIVGRLLRSRYSDTLILTPHHPLRGMIRGYGAVKSPTSISGQKDGTKCTVPHTPPDLEGTKITRKEYKNYSMQEQKTPFRDRIVLKGGNN